MDRSANAPLVIGVAPSVAERVQLVRLLGGARAVLLVASAEQARTFLELTTPGLPVDLPVDLPADSPADLLDELDDELDADLDAGLDENLDDPGSVVELPAGLRLDRTRQVVRWQDRELALTRLEHDLLRCLIENPGQVWTYRRLHHAVWRNEHLGEGSHIHSVVKRLRRKLTDLGATVTIHAVRGVGFHLLPAA